MKFKVKKVEHPAIIQGMSLSLANFPTLAQSLEIMDVLEAMEADQKKTETLRKAFIDKLKTDKTCVEITKEGQEVWTEKGQKEANEKNTELMETEVEYDFPQIKDYKDYPITMAPALYLLRGKLFAKA